MIIRSIFLLIFFLLESLNGQSQNWTFSQDAGIGTDPIIVVGDTVIVGSGGSLKISRDAGDTWDEIVDGLPFSPHVNDIEIINGIMFVTLYLEGVYKSDDYGLTWEEFGTEFGSNLVDEIHLLDQDRILLHVEEDLYLSPTGEYDWELIRENIVAHEITSLNGQDIFIASGSNGVSYSGDGGITWSNINSGLPVIEGELLHSVRTIAINETGLYCGVNSNGVFKYNFELETWEEKNVGINNITNSTQFRGLLLNGTNVLVGTQLGDVYYSDNGGESFENISIDEYVPVVNIGMNENWIYVTRIGLRRRMNDGLYIFTSVADDLTSDFAETYNVNLFPNPASNSIEIETEISIKDITVIISNITGDTVLSSKNSKFIDLGFLKPGMYLVTLTLDNQVLTCKKLIKK